MRSGLPLPSISLGVALITAAAFATAVLSTEVASVPVPSEAAPVTPEVADIGGDQPPMEFTPAPSAVRVAPRSTTGRPTSPPPHSNPVVRPEAAEPRDDADGNAVMPSVPLPSLTPVPSMPLTNSPEPSASDTAEQP